VRLRDPRLLEQAFSARRKHGVPDDQPTTLSIVGALVLLALVIATATWVPA
jgi:hypothetical protein